MTPTEKRRRRKHERRAQRSHATGPMSRASRAERGRALLERADGHAGLRNALAEIGRAKGEWAGVPMPLSGEQLVIEPSYPYAQLAEIGKPTPSDDETAGDRALQNEGWKLRNTFWSVFKTSRVLVIERPDGKVEHGIQAGIHHLDHDLRTLGCADAWGLEQEHRALDLLATLVRHRQFKQYLLTGMFLETSPRSGVHYLFRRLKPTVAMTGRGGTVFGVDRGDRMKVLCALCLHPIGYYAGSWAGSMTPTDDVIGHLSLMRGDEAMFWRRAQQHPAWTPEAGL